MSESTISKNIRAALIARGARPIKYHGGPYSEAGIPDLLVCYRGFSIHIETKQAGQTPTLLQLQKMADLRAAGSIGGTAYCVKDALEYLRDIDCIMQDLEIRMVERDPSRLQNYRPCSIAHLLDLYP